MCVLQGNPPWACHRIRHELLRPVSAMGFQQLGRPVGNPPYHPDGPPWLAGLGLRRWYTHLVYPQQYPPGNFKIATSIRYALFLVKSICHSSSSFCVWMAVLDVPLSFMSQSAIDNGFMRCSFSSARFLGSVGSYHKIRHNFCHVVPSRVRFSA
jgi:hypothetical protein